LHYEQDRIKEVSSRANSIWFYCRACRSLTDPAFQSLLFTCNYNLEQGLHDEQDRIKAHWHERGKRCRECHYLIWFLRNIYSHRTFTVQIILPINRYKWGECCQLNIAVVDLGLDPRSTRQKGVQSCVYYFISAQRTSLTEPSPFKSSIPITETRVNCCRLTALAFEGGALTFPSTLPVSLHQ